jgi:cation-transporting ATPase 13A2
MHRDAEEESHILQVECLRLSSVKSVIFYILCILSGGILFLLQWWFINLHISLRYKRTIPANATHLVVHTEYAKEILQTSYTLTKYENKLHTFEYHHLPYFIEGNTCEPLYMPTALSYKEFIDKYEHGLVYEEEVQDRANMYGKCQILVPIKPLPRLVVDELLHPFFVFQLFSVVLWLVDGYRSYAYVIIFMTVVSLTSSLLETMRNLKTIRKMAYYECPVNVLRAGEIVRMSSVELVPGDLIEVPENSKMPCDAVLINGACIIDEAMLTGESVPVLKDPLPYLAESIYDLDQDRRHSLYEGTFVIQTRNYSGTKTMAVVTRTGFMTMKGKLVRSILFPKPSKFKFYEDSLKFIAVLAILSIIGFFITLGQQISLGINTEQIIDNSFNLVTTTVPPALPVAMSVGTAFAISRMKKQNIFCISPPRVNVAGKIDLVVFDKTGTLTEDGMDLLGVRAVVNDRFTDLEPTARALDSRANNFVECMATCHSLTHVKEKLIGDTQDLRIFESTGWVYEEPDAEIYDTAVKSIVRPPQSLLFNEADIFDEYGNVIEMLKMSYEVGILHIFHFTSKLKRMGVVVKNLQNDNYQFYMKGAPELVTALCKPETLPPDFPLILGNYTRSGYRVLACAGKRLESIRYEDLRSLSLENVERDLEFLGLIILQNRLKPETMPALEALNDAHIRTVMATGDAALTGITVARECGMIGNNQDVYLGELMGEEVNWHLFTYSQDGSSRSIIYNAESNVDYPVWYSRPLSDNYTLALSGATFAFYLKMFENGHLQNRNVFNCILEKAKVYARMSPDHKARLIELFQERNLLVAMCGDGANDCGALKAANVGISLSEAEASIAAPFTSRTPNISCVLKVLQEGRCALTTSLQCFKYMALYSMIQSTTVSFLFWFGTNLSNTQYLSIDLFTILPLTITMCQTEAYHKLSKRQPTASLVSFPVLSSVIGQTIIQGLLQVISYEYAIRQSFFEPLHPDTENMHNNFDCYENTVLFLVAFFEYVGVCAVFSIGKPWRKSAHTNAYFTITFILLTCFSFYIILYPAGLLRDLLILKKIPFESRCVLAGMCTGYFLLAYLFEKIVINWLDQVRDRMSAKKKKYSIKPDTL